MPIRSSCSTRPPSKSIPKRYLSSTRGDFVLDERASATTRTGAFARVAPNRLRALWAGLLSSGRSAHDHWRCLLANATGADPAFAPLRGGLDKAARFGEPKAPTFFEAYLRAANYEVALMGALSMVIPDDPDPKLRVLKSGAVELFMAMPFDDIARPRTAAESEKLRARQRYMTLRARSLAPDASARHEDVVLRGEPVKLALTDAELAALGRVRKAADRPAERPGPGSHDAQQWLTRHGASCQIRCWCSCRET